MTLSDATVLARIFRLDTCAWPGLVLSRYGQQLFSSNAYSGAATQPATGSGPTARGQEDANSYSSVDRNAFDSFQKSKKVETVEQLHAGKFQIAQRKRSELFAMHAFAIAYGVVGRSRGLREISQWADGECVAVTAQIKARPLK